MKKVFFILGACAVLAGCAAAGNSIVSGEYFYPGAVRDRWPVYIVAADGQYQAFDREVHLDPGMHTLVLVSRKPPILHLRPQETFPVKTEPCKRYYLAAQHSSPLVDKWDLVIDHVEDIPGCSPGSGQGGVTTSTGAAPKGA